MRIPKRFKKFIAEEVAAQTAEYKKKTDIAVLIGAGSCASTLISSLLVNRKMNKAVIQNSEDSLKILNAINERLDTMEYDREGLFADEEELTRKSVEEM